MHECRLPSSHAGIRSILALGVFLALAAGEKGPSLFQFECSAFLTRTHLDLPYPHAELNKNPVDGFSAGLINDDDIYKWDIMIIGPPDTL